MLAAAIRSIRPQQWVRNGFVLAPLVFARRLGDTHSISRAVIAAAVFCLLSGAVYTFNDLRDVEADRAHAVKRSRPIASGALPERTALWLAATLAVISLAGAFALSWQVAAFAGGYLVTNLLYTLWLKHVAWVDISLIAAGFILRVLAGAAAIPVPPSRWLVVCTALLAVFLALGKRAHELAWAISSGAETTTRAALAGYRMAVVRRLLLVLAITTCGAYVAYTLSPHTRAFFGTDALIYTAPFPIVGLGRFLMLALFTPRRESPTEAMLRDPIFLANLVAWGAVCVMIVYR